MCNVGVVLKGTYPADHVSPHGNAKNWKKVPINKFKMAADLSKWAKPDETDNIARVATHNSGNTIFFFMYNFFKNICVLTTVINYLC